MTGGSIVHELILRLAGSRAEKIYISRSVVGEWPEGLLEALVAAKIIRKSEPALQTICPGCHHACSMKVFSDTHGETGATRNFIACDRRDDIGYVRLQSADLEQWQLSLGQIASFLKTKLRMIPTSMQKCGGLIPLGRITGVNGPRLAAISTEADLHLVVGSKSLPIAEAIFWSDGDLTIDIASIQELADRDGNAVHEFYTPSTEGREARKAKTTDRHLYWKTEYKRMKSAHPEWSDESIAETISDKDPHPGSRSSKTVRRYMK